jgi:hypothetical protein
MRGPDYELARITNWEPDGTGMARLSLADGTSWIIPVGDKMYPSARRTIELAERLGQPIFVSGDRRTGRFDQVSLPERLRPARVASDPVDGKVQVVFHGPPSIYFLRSDRPWFDQARKLLVSTIRQETPATLPPELLVTIDIATMEVMDVRLP